jgi:two-component system, NarL family, invasion response regulator UvrY
MIRLLLIDDHALIRAGIRRILEAHGDIEVAAEAGTGAEALEVIRTDRFDIILLDLSLPDYSGIDLMKSIRSLLPHQKILVLSMHPEENYARRLIRAGAAGYLNKEAAPELLISAIRKIASGGRFVSPALAELLAIDLAEDASEAPHERLSDREFEVFERIVRGESVSEIARDLHLSPKTISTHRSRILLKMDLRNNADLIRYAIDQGLLL